MIMPDAHIKKGAVIKYAIIGEGAVVGENAQIGDVPANHDEKAWGISVVGSGKQIDENSTIKPNEIV